METRDTIRMANQIASFFNGASADQAAKDVAEHINKFWEPHMRADILALLAKGAAGLDPTIIRAASLIKRPNPQMA